MVSSPGRCNRCKPSHSETQSQEKPLLSSPPQTAETPVGKAFTRHRYFTVFLLRLRRIIIALEKMKHCYFTRTTGWLTDVNVVFCTHSPVSLQAQQNWQSNFHLESGKLGHVLTCLGTHTIIHHTLWTCSNIQILSVDIMTHNYSTFIQFYSYRHIDSNTCTQSYRLPCHIRLCRVLSPVRA